MRSPDPLRVALPLAPPTGDRVSPETNSEGWGTLSIRVQWPERDRPGFRAATIPHSAATLVVQVSLGGQPWG